MGRILLNAAIAGVLAFFAFRVVLDIASFASVWQPLFLRPSVTAPAAGEVATYASLSYWGAALVAAIVAVTTPLARWSQARDAARPVALTAEQRAAARELMVRLSAPRAPQAQTAPQAPPVTAPLQQAADAFEPAAQPAPAVRGPGATWRPGANAYSEKLRNRYGAAPLRRARKVAEKSAARGKAKAKPAARPATAKA